MGVTNAMEEYNQFNEVPAFDTSIIPVILESEKTPYLRSSHEEGVNVTKAKKKKGQNEKLGDDEACCELNYVQNISNV